MRETERGENAMNVIVAVDENWGIGKDGDQLVYLSQDLKRFKALTTGHPVILGRKTLATFPGGRPLKGRRNLILSRDPAFAQEGAEVFRDLEALRSAVSEDAFVIGGAFGYTDALRWRADMCWSFSKLTFTHQMIRLLLVEQIYRAFKISRGEKYHW